MTAPTDEELMLAYARGDVRAFQTLYERHRGGLYRFLLRAVRDQAPADELFQETWSRLIGARERYRPEAKFSTFLLQIAHNLCVDHFRRLRPETGGEDGAAAIEATQAPEAERPEQQLSAFEERRRLARALESLPEEQRVAFLLRAEQGLSIDAIGEVTGVGRETAKSRLRYALARLKEQLGR